MNLAARIAEAEREGWRGETEGFKVSLAAADAKPARLDVFTVRRASATHLSMPTYRDVGGRLVSTPKDF